MVERASEVRYWQKVRNLNTSAAPPAQPTDEEHGFWKHKRLSPGRLQIRDIRLDEERKEKGTAKGNNAPLLVCSDVVLPDITRDAMLYADQIEKIDTDAPMMSDWERASTENIFKEYGWTRFLRDDRGNENSMCRWIHISSMFPDHLEGILLGMSFDQATAIKNSRVLRECLQQSERFSKHGKYFSPFHKTLDADQGSAYPLLVSVPFIDWTVYPGPPPPPRFQVDPFSNYVTAKSLAYHPIRSLLQYYYRLEDTADRDKVQVYNRHRPWVNDRNFELKAQYWYKYFPTGLCVDELWVLVLDERHIISFSNNQSWKPVRNLHQLPHRVSEVAFRGLRNNFHLSNRSNTYDAGTHLVAILSGSVGLLHWSFWADIMLCLTDRYSGYLGHLQYRLHRSASTKLVLDLLQIQDELNIVIEIIRSQWNVILDLQRLLQQSPESSQHKRPQTMSYTYPTWAKSQHRFKQYSSSSLSDPWAQLVANLDREFCDLNDLRENCDKLVTRTVQLVNMRLEDHGKAILTFTIVTVFFLPLSFAASFFGMNTIDIRTTTRGQGIFWAFAMALTAIVVGGASFLAFYGSAILENYAIWRAARSKRKGAGYREVAAARKTRDRLAVDKPWTGEEGNPSFRVIAAEREGREVGY